ncbi:signal peptidase I [Butyrivibrio sp. MC2013]|uniref:signal peptidase I n=1 Tax=Butyrivibrio sp. MC2013 TaxID=1280686 RepID=UPI0004182328|nr:signal peptidase I [Butyrivibrio sp. MC2013]
MGRRRRSRKEFHLVYGDEKKIITPELIREILSFVFYTVCAVAIAYLLSMGFGKSVQNVGDSMEPTISSGQTVLVNRVTTGLSGPSRGSIIAFLPNGNTNLHYYIKRVVGVPGDSVQIIDGALYINGAEVVRDSESFDEMVDAGIASSSVKLGNGEFFVLGDNRNASEDSRSADIGIVKSEYILGSCWYYYGGGEHGFIGSSYPEGDE